MSQTLQLTEAEFQSLKLFQDVQLAEVSDILMQCEVQEVAADEVFIQAGEANQSLFLVIEGTVEIHVDSNGPVAVLGPGDCIGELSLIDHGSVSASVLATSDCRLLVISEESLWTLVHASHGVSCNLLRMLAQRLREGNEVIRKSREELNEFQVQVTLDGLTGLQNRHWLDSTLPRFVERACHNDEPFAILMIDIDYFKQYNDQHGHPSGDQAIHVLAKAMRSNLRPGDMAARYGGDEFAVLLPNADVSDAGQIAERLLERVKVLSSRLPTPPITVSVGYAELQVGQDHDELLKAADEALYRAKLAGRDCAAV